MMDTSDWLVVFLSLVSIGMYGSWRLAAASVVELRSRLLSVSALNETLINMSKCPECGWEPEKWQTGDSSSEAPSDKSSETSVD